jgi:hypothetical protein
MKKLDLILSLKKYIQTSSVQQCYYYEDGCYCSIGYLLELNGYSVQSIDQSNQTKSIMDIALLPARLSLSDFNIEELVMIQDLNDEGDQNKLLNYVESLIQKEMITI